MSLGGVLGIDPAFTGRRGYANELQKTIQAQSKLAPLELQTEAQVQPFESAQTLANLNDFLNGTQAMDLPQYQWQNPVYKKKSGGGGLLGTLFDLSPASPGNLDLFGGGGKGKRLIRPGGFIQNGTTHRAAQRGFLDIFQNDIIPSQLKAQTAMRQGDINDVMNLGPQARAALRQSNPQVAALLDLMDSSAQSDLSAGTSVNPADLRQVQQYGRAGAAARGMGFGPNDNFQEALNSLNYGKSQQDRARAFGNNVIGQEENFYGNPFQQILNRNSTAGQAGQQSQQALIASKLQNFLNPESQYANGVYDNNAVGQQNATNASASNNAALIGGLFSSLGSAAGAAAI